MLTALFLLLSSPAEAYEWNRTVSDAGYLLSEMWDTDDYFVDWYVPEHSADDWQFYEFGEAIEIFDDHESGVDFRLWDDPSVGDVYDDDYNRVLWRQADAPRLNEDWGYAYTWVDSATGHIDAAAIFMNEEATFAHIDKKDRLAVYSGTKTAVKPFYMHEFGHTIGMAHEADEYNLMGQNWNVLSTNGSWARAYLPSDTAHGVMAVYGYTTLSYDVSVVHWKRTGRDDRYDDDGNWVTAYSTHGFTGVYDSLGNSRWGGTREGEPYYNVTAGQSYDVEFTLENNGPSPRSDIPLKFVLSSNHKVDLTDPIIKNGMAFDLPVGKPKTVKKTVTIPASTAPGDYWLGAVLVPPGWDSVEYNNATYLRVKVN